MESETHEMKTGIIKDEFQNENVVDDAGGSLLMSEIGSSYYINNGQDCVNDINRFLERPIIIDEGVVTSNDLTYDIWKLLSDNDRIKSKFEKFAFFQGDIEVTIAFSGTPFHYGKYILSYQPYPTHNKSLEALEYRKTVAPTTRILFLNYLSQSRNCKIIDVKENSPVKIHIPFISHKPMFRLFNQSAAASISSFDDFANAGRLYLCPLNPVGSVSSTPSDVGYVIYANFVNVKLGTLTGTHMVVESKMEETKDEQKTGPVTMVSSVIASSAAALTVAQPELAPFTVPAAIVAEGISQIASYFGWSRPIMKEIRNTMKPDGFVNGSHVISTDTCKSIRLDPGGSLEVSQGMFGDTKDEMVLDTILSRPAYFKTFTWSPTDVPYTTVLDTNYVHPSQRSEVFILQDFIQPTPLCFCAMPFSYWRGDIVFTFDFVCSAYHRGKVAIVFEPNISQQSTITSATNMNEQYMKIVDLQEVQQISLCVKWASPRPWLRIDNDLSLSGSESLYSNGFIYVVPITRLQSPDDSSIQVNVYVHGKDFHFAVPSSTGMSVNRGSWVVESETVDPYFNSEHTCLELNESTASVDNIHLTNFGESIFSFRTLLKRYHQYSYLVTTTGQLYQQVILPIYPNFQSKLGDSPSTVPINLLSYLRYAYLGIRGSYRHRVRPLASREFNNYETVNIKLDPPALLASSTTSVSAIGDPLPNDLTGGISIVPGVNPAIDVELPFYTNNLWLFAQEEDYIGSNAAGEIETYFVKTARMTFPTNILGSVENVRFSYIFESASGEDFNLHYFLGAPPLTRAP